MKRARQIFGIVLIAASILLGGYILWNNVFYTPPLPPPPSEEPIVIQPVEPSPVEQTESPEPTPSSEQPPVTDEPALVGEPTPDDATGTSTTGQLPVGKLVITKERKNYKDGNLTIYIPVIDITRSIYNGTDDATLNKGVGLFEYSQLPGEGRRNVSLAGHRNGRSNGIVNDHAPFYYIDLLEEGDYIYLYSDETIYRYVWEYSEIIEPDNWDPIRTTDYSCVTITSCHPIGISNQRIVVRGVLDEIIPFSEDYEFPVSIKEN